LPASGVEPPLASDVEGEMPPLDPPSFDPVPLAPLSPDPEAARDRLPLVEDRSFFAQPEPLKWTAGVVMALRSVPSAPQFGQNFGPGSLIPWITSVRCRQFEQT